MLGCVILAMLLALRPCNGKEVIVMDGVISFLVSVAARVVGYLVCKWLDGKLSKK